MNYMKNSSELIEFIAQVNDTILCDNSKIIIQTIIDNYNDYQLSLDFMVDKIGLHKTQVYEYCKNRLMIKPSNLICFVRMYYCLKLICNTEHCAVEIGILCGYKNQKTFRTNVHRSFNMGPNQLLETLRTSSDKLNQFNNLRDNLAKSMFFSINN